MIMGKTEEQGEPYSPRIQGRGKENPDGSMAKLDGHGRPILEPS